MRCIEFAQRTLHTARPFDDTTIIFFSLPSSEIRADPQLEVGVFYKHTRGVKVIKSFVHWRSFASENRGIARDAFKSGLDAGERCVRSNCCWR